MHPWMLMVLRVSLGIVKFTSRFADAGAVCRPVVYPCRIDGRGSGSSHDTRRTFKDILSSFIYLFAFCFVILASVSFTYILYMIVFTGIAIIE